VCVCVYVYVLCVRVCVRVCRWYCRSCRTTHPVYGYNIVWWATCCCRLGARRSWRETRTVGGHIGAREISFFVTNARWERQWERTTEWRDRKKFSYNFTESLLLYDRHLFRVSIKRLRAESSQLREFHESFRVVVVSFARAFSRLLRRHYANTIVVCRRSFSRYRNVEFFNLARRPSDARVWIRRRFRADTGARGVRLRRDLLINRSRPIFSAEITFTVVFPPSAPPTGKYVHAAIEIRDFTKITRASKKFFFHPYRTLF